MATTHQPTEKPLYNSRLIDNYIKLLKQKYPHVDRSNLLNYAGMKTYEIEDQAHWFTQTQVDRFVEKLIQLTENKSIAREAGQYAASPDALGVMRQYALGLIGPVNAFKLIGQATSNLVKSASYQSEVQGPNKVKLTVTPFKDVSEKPFQCENRFGFWEAIVVMLANTVPRIEHPECIFKGGKRCTYIISWKKSLSSKLKTLRIYSSIASIFILSFLVLKYPDVTLSFFLPFFLLFFLTLSYSIEKREKKEIIANVGDIKDSTDQLIEQMNRNYNNAFMANEIGQAISSQTTLKTIEQFAENVNNIDGILKKVIQILQKRLDYDRGLILLANPEKTSLEFRAGYGYSPEHQDLLKNNAFHLDSPESKGVFVVAFHKQEPFLINDISDTESTLSPRSVAFAKALKAKSFICCPIVCDGKSLGVLAVDNIESKRPLVNSDLTLLMGIAPVIGISLRNADLLNARRQQFHSFLHVLAKTIDARDPLTAGHSEKVTSYAMGICNELGQRQEYCEMIRVASLLHDYGKIAVPDSILKKPGRLTKEEYLVVKTHAQKTREILDQVNFEGIYTSVPEIAGAHHEKMDGSGYPFGLREWEIPLGARIIAVADFFEAITAKRHYREPMPARVAFELLRKESGTQFDPDIVEAFIRYFEKEHTEFFKESRETLDNSERKSIRVAYEAPVSYTIDGKTKKGTSADISALGIYIASSEKAVVEGSEIKLSFSLPDAPSNNIETLGRVAWVNNNDEPRKRSFPIGFGVQFIGLKKMTMDMVLSYILTRYMVA